MQCKCPNVSKMSFLLGVPVSDFLPISLPNNIPPTLMCGFSKNLLSKICSAKTNVYIWIHIYVKMYIKSICNIQDAIRKPYSQDFSFKLFKQQITLLIENLKINLRIIFCVLGIIKRLYQHISRLCSEKHDKLVAFLLYFFWTLHEYNWISSGF